MMFGGRGCGGGGGLPPLLLWLFITVNVVYYIALYMQGIHTGCEDDRRYLVVCFVCNVEVFETSTMLFAQSIL